MVCKICGAEIPDKMGFCPNCGAEVEKKVQDIPLQDAPEDAFDPEDGTTVLTEGMSGPLVADQFVKKPREHQPQRPEGKVETPAPVTGSSILSDESVVPASQPSESKQPQPAPQQPQAQSEQAPKAPQQPQAQSFQAAQGMPPKGAPQPAPKPQPQFNPQTGAPLQQQMPRPMGQPAPGGSPAVSGLGYFGYMVLFSIPLIGFIFAIIFAASHKNKNVKNFAIGWLLFLLFVIVINVIAFFALRAMGIEFYDDLMNSIFK